MRPVTVLPAPRSESPADSGEEAPTLAALAALSDAQVSDGLATWAGRVAAGEARLLAYLGEFDRREAWAGHGILSCAHWLSWRLGMGLKAASERVRVARALRELPETGAAFAAGLLSFTQVRAITRVASPDDEQTYVELARHATGSQIETLARGIGRARRLNGTSEGDGGPEPDAWQLATSVSYDVDGSMLVTVRLPAEHGAVLLAAVEAARTDIDAENEHRTGSPQPSATEPAGQASRRVFRGRFAAASFGPRLPAWPGRPRRGAVPARPGLPATPGPDPSRQGPPRPVPPHRPHRPDLGLGPAPRRRAAPTPCGSAGGAEPARRPRAAPARAGRPHRLRRRPQPA